MRKLDFIIIGAPKCGTTGLYYQLNRSEQVFMPPNKEMHFFENDDKYKKGFDWYNSFFEDGQNHDIIGEATPAYLRSEEAANRIKEYNPNIKLIAILRDPIDRLNSNYWFDHNKGRVNKPIKETVDNDPSYIEKGFYGKQLEQYLELFPKENILVLLYEDLINQPEQLYSRIFSFLKIDPYKLDVKTNVNKSRNVKSGFMKKFIKRGGFFKGIVKKLIPKKLHWYVWAKFLDLVAGKKPYDELPKKMKEELLQIYMDDINKLELLFDLDLKNWKKI